jgi:hypothetical protein
MLAHAAADRQRGQLGRLDRLEVAQEVAVVVFVDPRED